MIKKAKAGDVLYALVYNYKTEMQNIIKFTVAEDFDSTFFKNNVYIRAKNYNSYYPEEVFKSLSIALIAYKRKLESQINRFKKKILTVNKRLEKLKEE